MGRRFDEIGDSEVVTLQGEKGDKGDPGTSGPPGERGPEGPQGPPGAGSPVYAVLSAGTTALSFLTNTTVKTTISAAITLTTTVPSAGQVRYLIIVTSGTTSRIATFGTGFKPTATLATGTTANRVFVLAWISDGTNLYEASRTVAMAA